MNYVESEGSLPEAIHAGLLVSIVNSQAARMLTKKRITNMLGA